MKKSTIVIIIISAVLFFIGVTVLSIMFAFMSEDNFSRGNVAIIPVKGVIMSEKSESLFGVSGTSSVEIIELVKKADKNPRIKAIILEINSPGGSAVASDEIAQALKATDKMKVAWIREVGASGAYWIASACDKIIANRMSITGSIGVISSYLEFSGLLEENNVTYQRLVAGTYKDMGSPFRELSSEEEDMLQRQLDIIHEFFIDEIATNRGLSDKKTRELATGVIFIGQEAKENGLVDILGNKEDALAIIEKELSIKTIPVEYKGKESFLSALSGVFYNGALMIGRGFAMELKETENRINLIL